jgi:hypothetical protein
MEAMTKRRSHSVALKRQVAREFVAGEMLIGRPVPDGAPPPAPRMTKETE